MPSWMFYKQKVSTVNPKKTAVGYIPIIQAPASEHDTSNTVVKRVLHVAKSIEQQHLILTVDEALYPKCRTEVVRRSSGGAVSIAARGQIYMGYSRNIFASEAIHLQPGSLGPM